MKKKLIKLGIVLVMCNAVMMTALYAQKKKNGNEIKQIRGKIKCKNQEIKGVSEKIAREKRKDMKATLNKQLRSLQTERDKLYQQMQPGK